MKIIIGADHAGFGLKEVLKHSLVLSGHDVVDVSATTLVDGDDYPDYVKLLVSKVLESEGVMGVFCAGSGEGEAIVANRYKGIRAVVYNHHNLQVVERTRADNNANIFCIGARFVSAEEAKEAVDMWLSIPFDHNSRHARRLAKIDQIIPST